MSDVTYQALKRISYIPDRPQEYDGGSVIAGQEYYDVYFTGGAASNLIITGGVITGLDQPIAITDGGTGQTTANDALNALLPTQGGNAGKVLTTDGGNASWQTNAGGDVVGPASSTNNALVKFNGTTGKLVQNSGVIVDGSNNITGVTSIYASNAGNAATFVNSSNATSVQVARFEGDKAAPADNDEAYISLMLSNDAGTQTEFARMSWVATDVNVGTSVDGSLVFGLVTAGTMTNHIHLGTSAFRPVTNDSHSLGASALAWSDLFLASGAVINFNAGASTLTHSAGALTIGGSGATTLALGTNSLTMTGSIAATGARVTKGWFTNLESTNAPTVNGANVYYTGGTDVAVADGGTNLSSYTAGDILYASATTTLSKLAIGASGKVLISNGSAPSWGDYSPITIDSRIAASGTDVEKTGVTSSAKKISILVDSLSASGTGAIQVVIGDSGGYETASYVGAASQSSASVATSNISSGFAIAASTTAASFYSGIITLQKGEGNRWYCSGVLGRSDAAVTTYFGGYKELSATLDRVKINASGDTFDGGGITFVVEV